MANTKDALQQLLKQLENDIAAEQASLKARKSQGISSAEHEYALHILQGYLDKVKELLNK
jgi:hypothetical protein